MKKVMLLIALISTMLAGIANAGTNVPAGNITTSQTWTKANSPYHLKGQVYVTGGATLTIEAGTVVASFVADQGSLAICRDGKIMVMGTAQEPVIMTSAEDVKTWTGSVTVGTPVTAITTMGDPKTGTWREACNEWGNLTLMGEGLISASHYGGVPVTYQDGYASAVVTNPKVPNGTAKKVMEGLTADAPGDPKVLYGGSNDDDDSGEIHYLSLRYGGKVIGLANELNGLSLGAIGRETDIDHVEIMNNVDDGIEIWGGTVELKHVNIWNIGDDSFDVDEGWRGSAQYGLIVQGYSINASQGSGVGDNCFEIDGAEDSDAQPVTTTRISNFTVVGQPVDGDHGTAWRDNARVQYDNCLWMDLGEVLVKKDNVDGDGAQGYGYNGTLSWESTWTTAAGTRSTVNAGNNALVYDPYDRQDTSTGHYLAQITDSIFYGNENASAYTEAIARGVVASATVDLSPNGTNGNVITSTSPIESYTRGAMVTKGGKIMLPVTNITPIPADGVTAGGFGAINWLASWSAVDAYGMTDTSMNPYNGDVNNDGQVDLVDYTILSGNWLQGS